MKIKTFIFNPFQENTYLVIDDNNNCIVIDAGCYDEHEFNQVKSFIEENKLTVCATINTHLHPDHLYGVNYFKRAYNVEAYANFDDLYMLDTIERSSRIFGVPWNNEKPVFNHNLLDNEEVKIAGLKFKVIATPGHSKGGVCLYFEREKVLFSGDTLFFGSIGRTDLAGGDSDRLIESIVTKLFHLPDDVVVFCGHGPKTSIGQEKETNPFI